MGILITAFGVARILTNIPAGGLSERVGRRPLLIAGPLLTSLAALLTGLATQFPQLIVFRLIQGLGSALQTTTAMTTMADITTREARGRYMSLYQGSLLLGQSFGPALGGLVAERWGFRAVYFVYSGLALLAAIWAFSVVPETREHIHKASAPTKTAANPVDCAGESRGAALALLAEPGFILVSLVTLGIFFTRTGSRSTVLPLFGSSLLGLSPGQLGFTFTFIAIWNLLTLNCSGVLADKLGRKAVIVPGCVLSGLALWVFSMSGSYTLFLVSAALLGISTGLAGPAPAAYVADLAKPGQYGLTMGIYRTFGDVGVSVGPILLGWLSDRFTYAFALRTNALMLIVFGLAFGLWAKETMRRRAPASATGSRGDVRA